MKVQQRSTGLMADIVMNKTDGMETAAFIRQQMIIFPALAPLVLFLKLFLAQRNLHDTLAFLGRCKFTLFLISPCQRGWHLHAFADCDVDCI